MALKSRNTALAVAIQPVRDTFTAPNTTTDLLTGMSNLRFTQDPVTVADDSYTGSVFQNADAIAGKRVSLTFTLKLKPPAALPAANAWVPGRILQSAKFTEIRNASAIPAAPEALGAWTDSKNPTLGASAVGTASLYKGWPLKIGAGAYKTMTAIRAYTAGKVATLMEDWGSTPATNYQFPTFLMYARDTTSATPTVLSMKMWIDGQRYDLVNAAVTGLRMNVPTSTRDSAEFPTLEVTVDCTIYQTALEATPAIATIGTPPLYKDGKGILNYVKVGLASIGIDLGLQADYPPNPNQPDGVDAPELAGGTANATLKQQLYLSSTIDLQALADAQTYHPFFAQWGNAAGNLVQLSVPDGRLAFPSPDLSGGTAMSDVSLFIDVLDRNLNLTFPY